MKLSVATPLAVVVAAEDVAQLRAEDATGAFGILPGHADFLTALTVSVLTWRDGRGAEHHVAVRGGMLEVRGGDRIAVATADAVAGDDLQALEASVLSRFQQQRDEERAARADAQRLSVAAIRQIVRLLRPETARSIPGPRAVEAPNP